MKKKFIYKEALKKLGCTYLGSCSENTKMVHSKEYGTMIYCIMLAPSNMAFPNSNKTICPNDKNCKEFCLNGSGRNKVDILTNGYENSHINKARIKKTKFFYEDRKTFMEIMIHEISTAKKSAENKGLNFAVRINGTSDLNPKLFKYDGKCILDIFNDVQFFDYSKVTNRINVANEYDNYDLTLSFDGENWNDCEKYLNQNGRVAVIFKEKLPKKYKGYNVIDSSKYDMRYLDPTKTIMGLYYHKSGLDYVNNKYVERKNPAIIETDDVYCEW